VDDVTSLMREVKQEAGGMLPVRVYRQLHDLARSAGGGTLVEIGTYEGAGTLAMALGAKACGKPFHLFTVDLNDRELDRRSYLGRLHDRFRRFGVDDRITMVVGQTSDLLRQEGLRDIRLLVIDADGRIDRDLALLHERVADDAAVVIDDVDGQVAAWPDGNGWFVDQKHRIASSLAQSFCEAGWLVPAGVTGQTGFFRKGPEPFSADECATRALEAYRELVFTHARPSGSGVRGRAHALVAKHFPRALRLYRKLRRPEEVY
jgi:predicted O-methyltransferase YrrM